MLFAEKYSIPIDGELYSAIKRQNINKELSYLRPGKIRFQVWADIYTPMSR